MPSFTEILTASDADLVKYFYKVETDPNEDFILRINKAAAQMDLNHSQLVCALGFNKHIRDLSDIYSSVGFRSYKLLSYRRDELFRTDTYTQLDVDNIIDIYSERLEDEQILTSLREMLGPRLVCIEIDIEKTDDPGHIISYRMEVHSIYTAGIVGKEFAEERINNHQLWSGLRQCRVSGRLHPRLQLSGLDRAKHGEHAHFQSDWQRRRAAQCGCGGLQPVSGSARQRRSLVLGRRR